MRPGTASGRSSRYQPVAFALLITALLNGEPLGAQLQVPPPDTIQVDSTLLRIQQQLQGLARPPGIDSTYFLPDSLLSDSLRGLREARAAGQRPGGPERPAGGADGADRGG